MKDKQGRTIESRTCASCGGTFYARPSRVQQFCSLSCGNQSKRNQVALVCDWCGHKFSRAASKVRRKASPYVFCCRECKETAQKSTDVRFDCLRPKHYKTGVTVYRSRALKEYDLVCNRCGYNEHTEILVVHHIDRDRMNNALSNLEILCPNCHAIEHYVTPD